MNSDGADGPASILSGADWENAVRAVQAEAGIVGDIGGAGHEANEAALKHELSSLQPSALCRRARQLGASDSVIDCCADAFDPRAAYISLVVSLLRGCDSPTSSPLSPRSGELPAS